MSARNIMVGAFFGVFFGVSVLAASENIASYASPVTVNSFFRWGDTLWIPTSGGLRVHDVRTGGVDFISNSRIFPDLHLTSVCRDDAGNLWIGSRQGYLYRRTPRGQFTVFSNYRISGWGITSLYGYDGLVVVGSNRGVSLFDPVKGVALRNATSLAGFANSRVNVIASHGDTLFLGCDEGVAYLDSLDIVPLSRRNFYYPGIWKFRRSAAPVVSFVVDGTGGVRNFPRPAVIWRDNFVTVIDSGRISFLDSDGGRDSLMVFAGGGSITALYGDADGRRLWVGTDDHFYFSYDGEPPAAQHWISGMTLRRATRVMVAPDGNVWLVPSVSHLNPRWHHGIYMYDGRNWHLYNDRTYPGQFGYIGDNPAYGITAGVGGTVWVGMSGGGVKHIVPAENRVSQLSIGHSDFKNFSYVIDGIGDVIWGKCDAVAMDSSGYLWVSIYDCRLGSLVCYDQRYLPVPSAESNPLRARYRRFFTEPPHLTRNIFKLAVDAGGRIFSYDEEGRLTVFRHGGDPLARGITIDSVYSSFGQVSAITAGGDGFTYVAGTTGLARFAPGSLEVERIDSTLTGATDIAIQGNVLWLGSNGSGILRYDLGKGEDGRRRWIDESSGLPSNNVLSVAIDKKGGRLWAVTDAGVSQIDVGRAEAKAAPRGGLRAFPNVFSVGGSAQGAANVTFAGLEPRSVVSVYTLNGSLVAKVDAEHFIGDEWRAAWAPKRTLAPGTYIAVVKPSGKKTKVILKP